MPNTKLTRILSIDGGGIRGIIPGQILAKLESILQKLDNNPSGRLADYFDLIAGTSTGGILSCIYLCPDEEKPTQPRFSAHEAVELYMDRGDEIFDISLWQKISSGAGILDEKYSADALEDTLADYLGDLKLSQLLKPCLITSYDIRRRHAHFFTQHDARLRESHDFLVREVARATSAAPTYFEASKVKSIDKKTYPLIDGGVFANNPALCAYSEARTINFDVNRKNPKAAEMAILSLGTGSVDTPYYHQNAKNWGVAQWIKPLIDIMMSGVTETVHYQLSQIFDAVERPKQYLRIQSELGAASREMDDASAENLQKLRDAGVESATMNEKELTAFARLLIDNK
jgi:patatin-like phospholipase/acyl hydrolase